MAYNIICKKSVLRDLRKIAKSETRKLLDQLEKELSRNPDTYPSLKGQFTGLRRLRIGDYGVIFAILENEVIILRIAHRREVYKRDIKK